jgi:hypothetical protein
MIKHKWQAVLMRLSHYQTADNAVEMGGEIGAQRRRAKMARVEERR